MCRPLRKVYLNCTEWRWLSKYKLCLQYAAESSTLALIKYFTHQTAKILISLIWHARKYNFNEFCNPEIPELGRRQSRETGLAKTAEIPGFGFPGLQSLIRTLMITFLIYLKVKTPESWSLAKLKHETCQARPHRLSYSCCV